MRKRQSLILAAVFVIAVSLLVPTITFAQDGDNQRKTSEEARQQAERKREEIKQKTEALREQVKTKREEVKAKLDDRRKAQCEKHANNINRIANTSATQSRKHLNKFQAIEERVKQLVTDKDLAVENYDTLLATVDAKEAAAIAATDVALETKFSCDTTDPGNPGQTIRELMNGKNTALQEYRDALKALIAAVKQALETTKTQGEQ